MEDYLEGALTEEEYRQKNPNAIYLSEDSYIYINDKKVFIEFKDG